MIAWFAVPAAAGALGGTVRDAAGRPVAAATVTAAGGAGEVTTTTDAAGGWLLEDLSPGAWRVRAQPPAGSSAAEAWAPSAGGRCSGAVYELGDDDVLAVDVALRVGGSVRGAVRLPDGSAAAGATVTAWPLDGAVARSALCGPDGAFVIAGLPEDEALIAFAAEGLPDQYLGGEYDDLRSPLAHVRAGAELDVGTSFLRPGIEVAGVVRGPDGPVAGGIASVYVAGQLATVELGADGTYAATGLPAGEVLAWAEVEGLGTTYWPDADRPAGRLPLEDGDRYDALDLELPSEAVLVGRLLGGPWDDARAVLYNSDRTVGLGATIGADGAFAFPALHGGTYTLWVDGAAAGRVRGVVLDDSGAERVFTLVEGARLDAGELDLPVGGTLSGRLVDAVSGEPVAGAFVVAQPASIEGTLSAVADADGRYRIDGLGAGAWEVWAGQQPRCVTDPGWVSIWHSGTPNPLFAVPIEVAPGEAREWDVELPPDDDHDGMDDAWERANGLDPGVEDGWRDPDRDGFTNLDEYLLGTDPREERAEGCGCATGGSFGWLFLGVAAVSRRGRRAAGPLDQGPRGP